LKDAIYEGTDVATAPRLGGHRLHATTPVVRKWRNIRRIRLAFAAGPRRKAFVDFQNDVTVKDLTVAHQEGYVPSSIFEALHTLGWAPIRARPATSMRSRSWRRCEGGDTRSGHPPFVHLYPVAIGALAGRTLAALSPHGLTAARLARRSWREMTSRTVAARLVVSLAGTTVEDAYMEEMRRRSAVGLSMFRHWQIDVQDRTQRISQPIYVNGFAKAPGRQGALWGHADRPTARCSMTARLRGCLKPVLHDHDNGQAGEVMSC